MVLQHCSPYLWLRSYNTIFVHTLQSDLYSNIVKKYLINMFYFNRILLLRECGFVYEITSKKIHICFSMIVHWATKISGKLRFSAIKISGKLQFSITKILGKLRFSATKSSGNKESNTIVLEKNLLSSMNRVFKMKIYEKMQTWQSESAGRTALPLESSLEKLYPTISLIDLKIVTL